MAGLWSIPLALFGDRAVWLALFFVGVLITGIAKAVREHLGMPKNASSGSGLNEAGHADTELIPE